MHIFAEARGVVEALHAHDCGPALAWCTANKAKLKKIRSSLEFQLRVQVRTEPRFCLDPKRKCVQLEFPSAAAQNAGLGLRHDCDMRLHLGSKCRAVRPNLCAICPLTSQCKCWLLTAYVQGWDR